MKKFKTLQSKRERFYSNPGNPVQDDYQLVYDKDCQPTLEVVGSHNLYDMIQESKESCMIYNILERFSAGDAKAIQRYADQAYEDLTVVPKNIHEAYDQFNNAKEHFENLPVELRQEFGNNPANFLKSIQEDDGKRFNKVFGEFLRNRGYDYETPKEEVKADE